ncbi:hypothetical protein BpHYR1_025026 [Brachionus plicatilis]|uniref:Uncharacterized protein n=1 Tax=Brachionus plicatilis TaxID=10195 RepID=A0A3M7QVI5_BRAPC|nr:hypothetical protein BpHYR1_025026 [Brachionus plicatilis]
MRLESLKLGFSAFQYFDRSAPQPLSGYPAAKAFLDIHLIMYIGILNLLSSMIINNLTQKAIYQKQDQRLRRFVIDILSLLFLFVWPKLFWDSPDMKISMLMHEIQKLQII